MVFPFFCDVVLRRLEYAEEHCLLNSCLKNQILILKQDLRFLRTYVLCMELSEKTSFISFNRSKPLISSIEAASSEAAEYLYESLSGTRTLANAVSFTENKVKRFKPNIQQDYRLLLNQHSWDSSPSNYSSLRPAPLTDLCDSVKNNLNDLLESKNLIWSLKKQMEVLVKKLKFLKNLISGLISGTSWSYDRSRVMSSFMQCVLFVAEGAACLSYLCWVDETNCRSKAREVEINLSDLLQKFKTAELMEMHVTLLKASAKEKSGDGKREAVSFVNFLMENSVNFMNDQTVSIFEEMVFLMEFVIRPQTYLRDSDQILVDIKATAKEVGSFEYEFLVNEATENQLRHMNHVFSRLLEKMKLIKAEIFLIQQQDFEDSLIAPLKDRMLALQQRSEFLRWESLRSFLSDPREEKEEEEDIQQLRGYTATTTHEVTSLIHSMHEKKVTKETVKEVNLEILLLLEKIKLIEGEFYLMRLKYQKAEFIVPMKDQIITLHKGLKYFREFLMVTSKMEEDTEDGKLFLKHFKAVTGELCSFMLSFSFKEMANEAIDDADFQLVKLLEKINLVKAEISLAELPSHDVGLMSHMKDQVQTLQEGVRLLRILLLEPPKEFKEFGEQIWMKLEALAKEATCLVFLLYDNVMKVDMSKEMNLLLSRLIEKMVLLKAEIGQIYLQIPQPYPKTDDLGFLSSFLGNLRELLDCNAILLAYAKHQLDMVYVDLDFLISFLIQSVKQHQEHEELKVLRTSITKIAYELEYAVDLFEVGDGPLCIRMLWLSAVIEEIKILKADVIEISEEKRFDSEVDTPAKTSSEAQSKGSSPTVDEDVIGFESAEKEVVDRLTRGTRERDIIPIVGMAGLGKTTLAKEVFNNPTVTSHFHVRAWCCISQVYQKRQLLLDILSQISEITDQIQKMDAEDIALELCKKLRRSRYLIVMDDLWNIEAWNDFKESFPNDNNGSRVLFTSRLNDVAFKAKSECKPYFLHQLSSSQSWMLLESKLFGRKGCPPSLQEVGMEIARKCDGLPLSVVVISGLLATIEMTPLRWKQVLRSLSSHIVAYPQMECLRVLELSYLHLPNNLKSCFLYFAAFPEDHEIPISKLSRLWIAEGFLQETDVKRLEDAAEDCLLDLIDRNLVIVAKTRSDGRVRSCRIHDLLRELCLRKAQEENFFQLVHGYDEYFTTTPDGEVHKIADSGCSFSTNPLKYKQRRLCIRSEKKHFTMLRPCGPRVHSLLLLAYNDWFTWEPNDISFISENFKLLRVLDLESINMGTSFPTGLELLVQLRYLAVRGLVNSVPTSIAKLRKLETFLLKGLCGKVQIPGAVWKIESLRHVHINDYAAFILDEDKLETQCVLGNLDTLSTPVLPSDRATEKLMRRLAKLRKLRCIFVESWKFPVLNFLTCLESLKIFYDGHGRVAYPREFSFPANLRKLTLSKFRLPWTEISTIGRLPNLEVLKLLFKAFEGRVWETREGEFKNLKYLKLEKLDIAQWKASNDNFPSLEQLVLQRCTQLEEVPLSFGEIPTLQRIEVHWCAKTTVVSVKNIEEEQRDSGNEELKVLISELETEKLDSGNEELKVDQLYSLAGSFL